MKLWGILITLFLSLPVRAVIAPSATELTPLLNGMQVPSPQLTSPEGQRQSLTQWRNGKPALLVFYRGGWCPYCNAQLSGLRSIEAELKQMGIGIIALSPDPAEQLRDGPDDVSYQLLSDRDLQASEAFGIAYTLDAKLSDAYKGKMGKRLVTAEGSERVVLPVPAVYLVDADGLVHFSYLNPNYKVRVTPELILAAAKGMMGQLR
ncbi:MULTISPECIES: peroxiredoxin-like family protein [Ferrimonas]|uniref:peroxiredoxin-like family protein n=1 Tax=Ferrimonas TaxID=44011 RepID=UPI0003F870D6|nr:MULTISPECIES: peroxiredoxin-like family protein [Ferrimonas]USD36335.1 AhpC/TSA family protein [Ferrimonas sp. SCSIO 43195]